MPSAATKTPTRTRKPAAKKAAPVVEPVDPIRAKDLAAALGDALLFAGRDYILPVLAALQMEADGTRLTICGTNRYAIGVRTEDLPSDPFTFLLSRDNVVDLISLLKSRPDTHKRGPEVDITVTEPNGYGGGRLMTVKTGTLTVQYEEQIGEFPKWKSLVDKMKANTPKDTVGTCGLNAQYLALFARVSTVGPMSPLRMRTTASTEAVTFTAGRFWGALMPVRLSENVEDLAA